MEPLNSTSESDTFSFLMSLKSGSMRQVLSLFTKEVLTKIEIETYILDQKFK